MDKEYLIKLYFKKSLSESEKKEFDFLIENDRDFKALFLEYSDFNAAFKLQEAHQLKDFLNSIETNSSQNKAWHTKSWLYYCIAAVLVLGLCLTFLIPTTFNSNALYNDYFEVYPNVEQPILRGRPKTDAYKGFNAYENENFKLAAERFKALLKDNHNPNIRFYYAMSLLNSKDYDMALKELSKLELSKDFNYKDETLWYIALIYIKKEQKQLAIKKLEDMDDSTFKSKERAVLLQKLK